ncbi:hypothetical protein COU37_02105 [Candidatus Micrarchaeota archaeon CG10_big_fil_rev_8_21_14_0_10_45_29]|nr:MAG: hypothetical protein COU37_02105 [Candidatus Micrarchaeota archaeon CG10_big_fil_rev_8_21_14_0_10_45_29]
MKSDIDEAFTTVSKIVLGTPLKNMDNYGEWLSENVMVPSTQKSAMSQTPMPIPSFIQVEKTRNLLVTLEESLTLSGRNIGEENTGKINLQNAPKLLKGMTFYSPEGIVGKNTELYECSTTAYSSYCYKLLYFANNKFCAFCMWPRESEYVFGCDRAFSSKTCIKCYDSLKLSRCFEVSNSTNCSDCYFCHNLENSTECMFCFNAKSLRYAIGNVQYPKEEYMKIKKIVLEEIAKKLEKDKKLELNIFNLGSK